MLVSRTKCQRQKLPFKCKSSKKKFFFFSYWQNIKHFSQHIWTPNWIKWMEKILNCTHWTHTCEKCFGSKCGNAVIDTYIDSNLSTNSQAIQCFIFAVFVATLFKRHQLSSSLIDCVLLSIFIMSPLNYRVSLFVFFGTSWKLSWCCCVHCTQLIQLS